MSDPAPSPVGPVADSPVADSPVADSPDADSMDADSMDADSMDGHVRGTQVRRGILLWSGIGLLLVAAFFSAVGALNRDVYGPQGLVRAYLSDIAAHDPGAALALPGADLHPADLAAAGVSAHASRELLRSTMLGPLSEVGITSETDLGDGRHRVIAHYRLGAEKHSSSFLLERTGTYLGLFGTWRFATSPLALAHVTVEHATTFTVNGLRLNPRAVQPKQESDFQASAEYLVFTPARYSFGHRTALLEATTVQMDLLEGGRIHQVVVDAEATARFTKQVQHHLDELLDRCAHQQVLQPTGCPFGTEIDDRVEGSPTWSITRYPAARVEAGPSGWRMPASEGTAHLSVRVRSLFDGTVSTLKRDIPFTVHLDLALTGDTVTVSPE